MTSGTETGGTESYLRWTVGGFLEGLAAAVPAPAAGCSAALVMAQAAALCAKAARLSARQLTADRASALAARAEQARSAAAALIDQDARAYQVVMERRRRARAHPAAGGRAVPADEGKDSLAEALSAAADVPMSIVSLAPVVAELAVALVTDGNPALRGDATTACLLAQAAGRAAAALVSVNLAGTAGDSRPAEAARVLAEVSELARRVAD